jgi:hypothetical protein
VPERLSDVTIQPVIFTFLFLYVFGSAIHIPGMRYQDYLLPGLIGQGSPSALSALASRPRRTSRAG